MLARIVAMLRAPGSRLLAALTGHLQGCSVPAVESAAEALAAHAWLRDNGTLEAVAAGDAAAQEVAAREWLLPAYLTSEFANP